MLNLLKVGYIVPFVVLKNLPDKEALLVKILYQSELLALLPRVAMVKNYKIGDTGFACVLKIDGARITLTQKSPQYVRKMLEYLLADVIIENKLKIKKIAGLRTSRFYKVAIGSVYDVKPQELNDDIDLNEDPLEDEAIEDDPVLSENTEQNVIKTNEELYGVLKNCLKEIDLKEYFEENTKFSFVRFSYDKKEYVLNALCPPGKKETIYKVIYFREMNKIDLLVDNNFVGFIMGKRGENIAIATKLCDVEIEVKGISTITYNNFLERR